MSSWTRRAGGTLPDSGPDYALEALRAAAAAREAGPSGANRAGLAAGAFTLPGLDFEFSSPSFLFSSSRWVLFLVLAAGGFAGLVVAYRIAVDVPQGRDPFGPALMSLLVSLIAFVFSYLTVMGFGSVKLKTTIGGSDGTPAAGALTVTGTVPADGATGIGRDVDVEATFSAKVDAVTVTADAVRVAPRGTQAALPATVTLDNDGTTVRLAPNADLAASTTYEVTISRSVKGADGAELAADKTWSFRTGA